MSPLGVTRGWREQGHRVKWKGLGRRKASWTMEAVELQGSGAHTSRSWKPAKGFSSVSSLPSATLGCVSWMLTLPSGHNLPRLESSAVPHGHIAMRKRVSSPGLEGLMERESPGSGVTAGLAWGWGNLGY